MDRTFPDEPAFRSFAREFAAKLRAGDVVGLSGPLGAGKTAFVQEVVAERLGGAAVSSPTFTFWHRYGGDSHMPGAAPVDHLDLYRIDDPAELTELGLEDAFDGTSIVLVEWWRNAGGLLPAPTYEIEIAGKGADPRSVSVVKR